MITRQLRSAVSWDLAARLARRHPDLEIRHEQPGGGMYDVLAARTARGCKIMLNRNGTVQIHGRDDGADVEWPAMSWDDVVRREPRELVAAIEVAAGLRGVAQAPRTSSRVLVYRLLASLAGLHATRQHEIANGIHLEGVRGPTWWSERAAEPALVIAGGGESGRQNAYWSFESREVSLVFATAPGVVWAQHTGPLELMEVYTAEGRELTRLLARVLAL